MGVTKKRRKRRKDFWDACDFHSKRAIKDFDTQENLKVEILWILGMMWSCREPTIEVMAEVIGKKPATVQRLVNQILESNIKVIQDGLAGIFTLESVSELPTGENFTRVLHCRHCGQALSKVPCCRCLLSTRMKEQLKPGGNMGQQPEAYATFYMPGSSEKISVMRWRHSHGFSVFSANDATIRRFL
jgi:hypothetical protein